MDFESLIVKNRSYRRFDRARPVERDTLRRLVDVARRTASAANRQPLKYVLLNHADTCARLFRHLKWAGALKDWPGPAACTTSPSGPSTRSSWNCERYLNAESAETAEGGLCNNVKPRSVVGVPRFLQFSALSASSALRTPI